MRVKLNNKAESLSACAWEARMGKFAEKKSGENDGVDLEKGKTNEMCHARLPRGVLSIMATVFWCIILIKFAAASYVS